MSALAYCAATRVGGDALGAPFPDALGVPFSTTQSPFPATQSSAQRGAEGVAPYGRCWERPDNPAYVSKTLEAAGKGAKKGTVAGPTGALKGAATSGLKRFGEMVADDIVDRVYRIVSPSLPELGAEHFRNYPLSTTQLSANGVQDVSEITTDFAHIVRTDVIMEQAPAQSSADNATKGAMLAAPAANIARGVASAASSVKKGAPTAPRFDIRDTYLHVVKMASTFIYIENEHFRWKEFAEEIKTAAQKMTQADPPRDPPKYGSLYVFVVTNSSDEGIAGGGQSTYEMLESLGRRDTMPVVAWKNLDADKEVARQGVKDANKALTDAQKRDQASPFSSLQGHDKLPDSRAGEATEWKRLQEAIPAAEARLKEVEARIDYIDKNVLPTANRQAFDKQVADAENALIQAEVAIDGGARLLKMEAGIDDFIDSVRAVFKKFGYVKGLLLIGEGGQRKNEKAGWGGVNPLQGHTRLPSSHQGQDKKWEMLLSRRRNAEEELKRLKAQRLERAREAIIPEERAGLKIHICTLTSPDTPDGLPWPEVFVHSKLMIINDAYMTLGTARISERSMKVNTELNIAHAKAQITQQVRKRLWAQHTGGKGVQEDVEKAFKEWKRLIDDNQDNEKKMKSPICSLRGFLRTDETVTDKD